MATQPPDIPGFPADQGALDLAVLRVRAAWRRRVEEAGWVPLVHLHARFAADPAAMATAAGQAAGGWLYVGPGTLDAEVLARGQQRAGDHGARFVHDGLDLGPTVDERRLRWEDQHHAVASDPTLSRQRVALLAHCRHGETVLLRGPPGAGRRALARWAHARLSTTPLVEVQGDAPPVHAPGRWLLLADPGPAHLPLLNLLGRADEPRLAPAPSVAAGERPDHRAFAAIVGRDPALCEAMRRAALHAPHDSPVLVLGETGTGKELLAQAVHAASGRPGELVAIDVGTLSEELAASTLFGHQRGAFSGATGNRVGAFRRAHRGTLFLDELANLGLPLQAQLLRVLERGEVLPLGADRPEPVDVRIVAATNQEPEQLVAAGRFRRDLLHRLDSVVIRLPPLRERPADIPLLAAHILQSLGQPPATPDALALLAEQPWPGNVRQLRNSLRTAAIEAEGRPLTPSLLAAVATPRATRSPVLITAGEQGLSDAGLPRDLVQQLSALSLHIPGLAARGAVAVRHAVHAALGGRPITDPALRTLENWPWWGHHTELERKLSTLCHELDGPIDRAGLLSLFPDMASSAGRLPICLLMHPVARADGKLRGLRSDHHAAAVLIGRATRLPELTAAPGTRLAWLHERVGDGQVDAVPFPHLPELSRAHVLLTRDADGLVVHRVPRSVLEVQVVVPGRAAVTVPAGGRQPVDKAADIRIIRGNGDLYLQLYAFLGQAAVDEGAVMLRNATQGWSSRPTQDMGPPQRRQAWVLSPAEGSLLVRILLDAVQAGDSVAPALRSGLDPSDALAAELHAYVLGPHPTQAVGRLFELDGNQGLREQLRAGLAKRGLDADRLPARIRRSLD